MTYEIAGKIAEAHKTSPIFSRLHNDLAVFSKECWT